MVNGILPTLGLVGTVALASFARRPRPGSANEGSWVYHASEPSHLPGIRRDGLQPRKPPIRGQPRAVYFAPTPDHALSWGSSQALLRFPWPSEWEDDAWGDTVFVPRPNGEEELCRTSMHTPHRIPPEQIELRVGKRWVPLVDPPPAASASSLVSPRVDSQRGRQGVGSANPWTPSTHRFPAGVTFHVTRTSWSDYAPAEIHLSARILHPGTGRAGPAVGTGAWIAASSAFGMVHVERVHDKDDGCQGLADVVALEPGAPVWRVANIGLHGGQQYRRRGLGIALYLAGAEAAVHEDGRSIILARDACVGGQTSPEAEAAWHRLARRPEVIAGNPFAILVDRESLANRVEPAHGSAARATPARVEALRDALAEWADIEGREDVVPEVVYHGTNGAKWAKTRGTPALHLSVDPHEAMEYACLSAMSQLDSGAPADPRVYRVNVYDLADSDLGPDRGSVDRYREDMSVLTPRQKRWFLRTQAWRATAEETGFFVVRYPRRDLLDRFEEVPRAGKRLLAEPRFAWPSIPEKA